MNPDHPRFTPAVTETSPTEKHAARLRTAVKAGAYSTPPHSPIGRDPVMPDPAAA